MYLGVQESTLFIDYHILASRYRYIADFNLLDTNTQDKKMWIHAALVKN